MNATVTLRAATSTDVAAINRLIADNLAAGHLLPRTIEDLETHAARFIVADARRSDRRVRRARAAQQGCRRGAVAGRRRGACAASTSARDLVDHMAASAAERGLLDALCVHARARSIRPPGLHDRAAHLGAREDRPRLHVLRAVPALRAVRRHAAAASGVSVRPERPAAVIQGSRSIAPRRPNIERLQLPSTRTRETEPAEAVLA